MCSDALQKAQSQGKALVEQFRDHDFPTGSNGTVLRKSNPQISISGTFCKFRYVDAL